MSIQVNALTKIYGSQKAIDNISFEAKEGEITGLVGPNGAGKTTTMKILTCYMPPSEGQATVCGLDVNTQEQDIKKLIGYLPEHNPLYGSMYIKEYLQFIARVHKLPNIKSKIADVIDMVGLGKEQHKRISQLSKGYKQRVGIAQSLIHDPKVLILDEPISGLDPNQLVEIRKMILNLKEGKTIIFSSHILQEVESICDKIVILNNGHVAADDEISKIESSYSERLSIQVEFLNSINPTILQGLGQGVNIEAISSTKYLLHVENNEDIRADIFDLAVAHNNKLLNLSTSQQSLENVFKSVTNN